MSAEVPSVQGSFLGVHVFPHQGCTVLMRSGEGYGAGVSHVPLLRSVLLIGSARARGTPHVRRAADVGAADAEVACAARLCGVVGDAP